MDSFVGTTVRLGPGTFGQNAVEVVGGSLFSQQRTGSTGNWTYDVTVIDPLTGQSTVVFPGTPDVRAMARDRSGQVFAVLEGGDQLATFDPTSGVFSTIGQIGFSGVQALSFHRGTLFAIDTGAGLLTVDPSTGAGVAVSAQNGIPAIGRQFLLSRVDGKLLCGGRSMYELDPQTGVATLLFALGGDFRGTANFFGVTSDFGSGCAGVTHAATGTLNAGGTIVSTSQGHQAGANGALLIGLAPAAAALPLDPIFGTVGCSLLITPTFSVPLTIAPSGDLTTTLTLGPDNGGFELELQHAAIEAVPGGLSTSNATRVFVGF